MEIAPLHTWSLTPALAIALQRELARRIDTLQPLEQCELVAGVDVSYGRNSSTFFAGVVVLRLQDLSVVERVGAVQESRFPYVPGLLSFREAPAVLEAFRRLKSRVDAVMVDAHGLAHPRRLGFACHLGLWLERPCLGCAKSVLIGKYREPRRRAGSVSSLRDGKDTIGLVVRTKDGVKPVFVSAGHKIDLRSAADLVLATCRGYRLPEPTRQAHLHVNAMRRSAEGGSLGSERKGFD